MYIDLSTALFIFWVHDNWLWYNLSPYILNTSKLVSYVNALLFVSPGYTESAVSATNLIFYKKPIYSPSVLFYEVYVVSNPLQYYTLVDQQKLKGANLSCIQMHNWSYKKDFNFKEAKFNMTMYLISTPFSYTPCFTCGTFLINDQKCQQSRFSWDTVPTLTK